jgi:hypothetical protein
MAKGNNVVHSASIRVTVSEQSQTLLEKLAQQGIYGRNAAEVAGRFVDAALQEFVDRPKLRIESPKGRKKQ